MRWKNKKQRKFWEWKDTRWNERKKLKKPLKKENVQNKMKKGKIERKKKGFEKEQNLSIKYKWLIYAWHFSKSTKYKFMFLKFISKY